MLQVIFLPFKIVTTVLKLLVRLILFPVRMIVAGMLLQIGMLIIVMAVVAVLVYLAYQWLS